MKLATGWKTTLSGTLSFVIATSAVFTALPPGWLNPHYSAALAIASGLAKAWVGLISQDAGTTEAHVPGGGVQNVPSHELPDDPKAVAVTSGGAK